MIKRCSLVIEGLRTPREESAVNVHFKTLLTKSFLQKEDANWRDKCLLGHHIIHNTYYTLWPPPTLHSWLTLNKKC